MRLFTCVWPQWEKNNIVEVVVLKSSLDEVSTGYVAKAGQLVLLWLSQCPAGSSC